MTRRLSLLKTCGACPEQYDVYEGAAKVGYLRLRHGAFRAECHGKVVYRSEPDGDGSFTDEERPLELHLACIAIAARLDDMEGADPGPVYDFITEPPE